MFLRRIRRVPILAQRLYAAREEQIPVTVRLAGPSRQFWIELHAAEVTEVGIDFVAFNNVLVRNKHIIAVAEISNTWVWDEGYVLTESTHHLPPRWLPEALEELQRERTPVYVLTFLGQVEEVIGTIRAVDNHYLIINAENDNRITLRMDHAYLIGRREDVDALRDTGALRVYSLFPPPPDDWQSLQNQQSLGDSSLEIEDIT